MDLDIVDLRIMSANPKDKFLDGGIPLDDMAMYEKVAQRVEENGYAYITVVITKGRLTEMKTIVVDQMYGVRGTVLFYYKKDLVFQYTHNKNIKVYYDETQEEYHFTVFKEKENYTRAELTELVDKTIEWNYNDILRCFGTLDDVNKFADKMDLNYATRVLLHIIICEKLQNNYYRKYGVTNPRISEQLDLLKNDDTKFFGVNGKRKYLNSENYVYSDKG